MKHKSLLHEVAGPDPMGMRQIFSDHPSIGLTPVKLAEILKNSENNDPADYLALAEDMEEKDLHYNAVLGTRKRQVSQLEITIVPASDSLDDEANADLVREFIERGELQEEMFDILDAVGKGFSITEILWQTSEKQWMIKSLERRDPRWFDFDQTDRRKVMLKTTDGLVPLDNYPYQFLTFFAKAKSGTPIRGGIARLAAWGYIFKNYDIKSWVQFLEVYGQPYRLGKFHAGATDEEKRTLLRAVAKIGRDAAATIPNNMAIEFVESKMSGNAQLFEKLATYLDLQVSKAVLGQTTTTDAVSGGHAVSKEHNEVRQDIERSDANMLQVALRRDIVRPLVDLNRGPQKKYPKILIGRADETNLKEFSETVKTLNETGLKISTKQVYAKSGLVPPENDEDILGPALETNTKAAEKTTLAQTDDDSLDDLNKLMMPELEEIIPALSSPIEKALNEANSFDAFKALLTRTSRSFGQWARDTRKTDTALGKTIRQTERARVAFRKLRQEKAKGARGGSGMGLGGVGGTLIAGAGVRAAFGKALTMESAEIRLKTAINADDKDAAVAAAKKRAKEMARSGPIDAVEAMNVNYALNSASLDAETALGGMASVLKTAKVTGGAAEQVGEVMATAMNTLGGGMQGTGAEKMARIGDLMTKTQIKFQFKDFSQLGEGLAYASSTAAASKVPIEQLLTVLGQLNASAVKGSRAGTAFNATLRSMTKASEELDFEITRTADGAMDYFATLTNLNEALSDYDNLDERNDKIQQIFGDEGKTGILPLLGMLEQSAKDLKDVTHGSRGSVDENFKLFEESEGGKLAGTMNSIGQLGEAIGASLLPAVNMLATPIGNWAAGLADIIDKHQGLGLSIGGAIAAFGIWKGAKILGGGMRLFKGLAGRGGKSGLLNTALGGGATPVRVINWPGGGFGGGSRGKGRSGRGGKMGRMGKVGGLLKGGGKLLSRAAGPLAALAYVPDLIEGVSEGNGKKVGGALGGAGGALGGAAVGAAIGTAIFPVVGTAIGALVGGISGGSGGEALGEMIGELFDDKEPAKISSTSNEASNETATPSIESGAISITVNAGPEQSVEEVARSVKSIMDQEIRGALHD